MSTDCLIFNAYASHTLSHTNAPLKEIIQAQSELYSLLASFSLQTYYCYFNVLTNSSFFRALWFQLLSAVVTPHTSVETMLSLLVHPSGDNFPMTLSSKLGTYPKL